MNVTPQRVWMLVLENGQCPIEDWLHKKIRDVITRAKIMRHIDKLERGIFGDWKSTNGDVRELRLDFGPGYRVYYAHNGQSDTVTILGGDKGSQNADITRSRLLWSAYQKVGAPDHRLRAWGQQGEDDGNDETEELR